MPEEAHSRIFINRTTLFRWQSRLEGRANTNIGEIIRDATLHCAGHFAHCCLSFGHFLAHQTFFLCLINTSLEILIAIFEQEGDKVFGYAVLALICGSLALTLSLIEFIIKGRREGARWRHGLILVHPASHGHNEQLYGSTIQAIGLFSALLHVILAAVDCMKRHYRWNWHIRFRIFPLAFVVVESASRFLHLYGHSGALYVRCSHGDEPREILVRAIRYGDAMIVNCVHGV